MSARLQRVISEPVGSLAGVVALVATRKDYSVRAVKQSEDELGQLIDGFNEMLNQLQGRDAELQSHHDQLELRVSERTSALQHEVRERTQAEEKLKESEHRMRLTLENQPECVKLVTPDGTLLEMNAAGLKVVEADCSEQVIGHSVFDFVAPEYHDTYRKLSARVFGGDSVIGEFELIGLKGTRRWMETHACPMRDTAGNTFAKLAVTRDVTERKRAERELENIHQKLLETSRQAGMAEVATSVLHNVGNVLNSVNVSATLTPRSSPTSASSSWMTIGRSTTTSARSSRRRLDLPATWKR